MTGPISFEERAGGREVAKLGAWEVGEVRPWPHGRNVRAYWSLALPPAAGAPRPAPDMLNARRGLLLAIADWLDGAGDPGRAGAVRAHVDAVERAAR